MYKVRCTRYEVQGTMYEVRGTRYNVQAGMERRGEEMRGERRGENRRGEERRERRTASGVRSFQVHGKRKWGRGERRGERGK